MCDNQLSDQQNYLNYLHSIGLMNVENYTPTEDDEYNATCSIPYKYYKIEKYRIYLGGGKGYPDFYSWMQFNKDGKFENYGAAE